MSTHTPGPWNLVSQRANAASGSPVLSEIWSGNYIVARLGALHTDRAVTDARLIAAAPDLLSALKDILGMAEAHTNRCKALRHNKGKPVIEAMEADLAAAYAAIRKAEGAS